MWLAVEHGHRHAGQARQLPDRRQDRHRREARSAARYSLDSVLASFVGAFPIDDPRYVVFVSLDEPKGDASTYGLRYGGWTAAPVVAAIIDRIGPILGVPPSGDRGGGGVSGAAGQAASGEGETHRGRRRALRLAALCDDRAAPAGQRRGRDRRPSARTRARSAPGDLFAAMPGTRTDGGRFLADARAAGAVAVLGDARAVAGHRPAGPGRRGAARRPGPGRRPVLRPPARDRGGRHRHQRQDLGRGVHPPALGRPRPSGRQHRHARACRPRTRRATAASPRPTRSPCTGSRPNSPRRASSIWRSRPPATAWTSTASTACASRLPPSPTSAATISTITAAPAAYYAAKRRLFAELLPPGAAAVLNADVPEFADLAGLAVDRELRVLDYGERRAGAAAGARARRPPTGRSSSSSCWAAAIASRVGWSAASRPTICWPPLGWCSARGSHGRRGAAAAGRPARAAGPDAAGRPPPSRRRRPSSTTPTSPRRWPRRWRRCGPHTAGRLVVVFGCGGDRDAGKRPLMGEIAARLADEVVVTDDNPRTEDPGCDPRRRAGRRPGCPRDRRPGRGDPDRLRGACAPGDTLLVAGKGHETYQIVGDRDPAVRRCRGAARRRARRRGDRVVTRACGPPRRWPRPPAARSPATGSPRACRSTRRTLAPGDLFVALDGPNRDAHAFVAAGARAGRRRRRGQPRCPRASPIPRSLVLVGDTQAALEGLGRAGRRADHARGSPASPAASARPAPRRRCATSWLAAGADPRQCRQPQQSLGRAA